MRRALADAIVDPQTVACIFASANGSRHGDAAEARAIRSVFGDHASTVPIQAIKASIGETLGAAGALQAAAGSLALQEGALPTTSFHEPDPASGLRGIGSGSSGDVRVIMVNAFGCDGISASVVIGRSEEA
jgi:3-oxoacyl-[acyl-carrier-protein] synthase II